MKSPLRTQARLCSLQRANRFSLMEVLIAMLVLAIGLLGLASLQAQSLKFNHDSYVRSQSTFLAYEMMDRMRANPAAVYSDGILDPIIPDDCDLAADATLVNSVDPLVQKCFWLADVQGRLPAGTGSIVVNTADPRMFDVTILWSDREIDNAVDCGAANRVFDGATNLCMVSQIWTVFPI